MPLRTVQNYLPGMIVLSSRIQDAGLDGIGGNEDGTCRFIAPARGRVRSLGIAFHIVAAWANTGVRVSTLNGTIGDAELVNIFQDPVLQNNGAMFTFPAMAANNHFEAGDVIIVEMDGGAPTPNKGNATLVIEPDNPQDLPSNLYVMSEVIYDAVSASEVDNWPVPFPIEILSLQVGTGASATSGTFSVNLQKDAGSIIIGSLTNPTSANRSETFDARTDSARFLSPDNALQATITGSVGSANQKMYNIICRRL